MTTITLDVAEFRTIFPAYASPTDYPDLRIQAMFDLATAYISPVVGCEMAESARKYALYLMTAHLLWINDVIANGGTYTGTTGSVQGSKVGDVQVTLTPPPFGTSAWRYWLMQSPYGQMLVALLDAQSVGGFLVGALPERAAFRRVDGDFGPPGVW